MATKRKRRKPATLEGVGSGATGTWGDPGAASWVDIAASVAAGDTAGSGATYSMGDGTTTGWEPSQYPNVDMWITVNGPAPDAGVTSWTVDSPALGLTTWFRINPNANLSADIGAATDTAAAVGTQIADIGTGISNTVQTLFQNIVPILIGLAALYVWRESERK